MSCQEDMKLAKEFIAKSLKEFKSVEHALTHVKVRYEDEWPEVIQYLQKVVGQVVGLERIQYFLNGETNFPNDIDETIMDDDDPELGT